MRPGARTATTAVLVMCVCAAVWARAPLSQELTRDYTFEQYVVDFHKSYGAGEHAQRKTLFTKELARVLAHNAVGTATWRMGVDRFSDWTAEERKRLSGVPQTAPPTLRPLQVLGSSGLPLPASVDWRTVNPAVLTGVKDQGNCGDCYAHSVTESLESYWALATGNLFVLSQQQITSCAPPSDAMNTPTPGGCSGDWPTAALDYAVTSSGITQEWVLPFQSYGGVAPNCTPVLEPVTWWSGYNAVESNSPYAFAEALVSGPLTVVVDDGPLQGYSSGVLACNLTAFFPAHVVQAVGYGHDAQLRVDYWVIRNSWAPSWGENGYVRLLRDPAGEMQCTTAAPWGTVCGACGVLWMPLVPVPAL